MTLYSPFRAATVDDCYAIAELFSTASNGVSNYEKHLSPSEMAELYGFSKTRFAYSCPIAPKSEAIAPFMPSHVSSKFNLALKTQPVQTS